MELGALLPPPAADTWPNPATFAPPPSHPSYAEMITAAIVWDSSQGKQGGSSKRAIAKYIDRVYTDLPSTHSSLLTHHLKRLKNSGHLIMIKNSYQLPSPAPPHTGSVPQQVNPTPKRRPGRPPKPKTAQPISPPAHVVTQDNNGSGTQPAKRRGRPPKQQIQQHQIMMAPAEVPFVQPISEAQPIPANELAVQKRRPGRPHKQPQPVPESQQLALVNTRATRPAKYSVGGPAGPFAGGTGRPRGRPKKNVLGPLSSSVGKRPRGRPPKQGGVAAAVGKRRGRPPKESGPPKPLGRPKKYAAAAKQHSSELGMANEELTRKLEIFQSKIRDAVGIIRPYVANENVALMALQQLEELVTPTVITAPPPPAPPTAQPMMATAMTVDAPPIALAHAHVPAPAPATVTAAPNLTVPAPFVNAPGLFSVTLQPMSVTAPFQVPSGIDNQQSMTWMPSSRES